MVHRLRASSLPRFLIDLPKSLVHLFTHGAREEILHCHRAFEVPAGVHEMRRLPSQFLLPNAIALPPAFDEFEKLIGGEPPELLM
jgi:hypothetical protein